MSSRIRAVILISLLLNLLLGGLVIGHLLQAWQADEKPEALAQLTAPQQEKLQRDYAALSQKSRDGWAGVRPLREETMRLLVTEPFDEAAYDAQVKKLEQQIARRHAERSLAVKELAKGYALEERKALAAMVMQSAKQWQMVRERVQHSEDKMTKK